MPTIKSIIFIFSPIDVPEQKRLEAVQYCMLLIEDEHRDVLQLVLHDLYHIALNHKENQVFTFK